MNAPQPPVSRGTIERMATYPLLDALIGRRSRRFAKGMHLNGGPLAYASRRQPQPLTPEEEAALTFAACGITGPILGDLPYKSGDVPEAGDGQIMAGFIGRTAPSGDGLNSVTVFVINDEGAWMIKRPQDYPRETIAELAAAARRHDLVPLYERSRVRIADERVAVPREGLFVLPFNRWSANVPGTTYFVLVSELSALYINMLLTAFSDELRTYVVDDRNRYRPAGVGRFARSRGGHLHDDPADNRFGTVLLAESWIHEFAALEQGMILQNLGLMTQALGLGGFPHSAVYPGIWCQALGFRMASLPFSRTIGAGRGMATVLRALKKDLPIPTAIGLERGDDILIKPYCPPYYPTMEAAVMAFVDAKYAEGKGVMRDGGAATAWKDGATVQAGIPRYADRAIDATIAYCDYLYRRYGQFPAYGGPLRTVLAYQAHHLDPDFYDQFYHPDALSATQQADFAASAAPI